MPRKLISTGSPFEKTAGYSRAVVAGDCCYVSGTTGYDYESMTMPEDVVTQTRNALATIEKALGEAGFAMTDVVRARYVITTRDDMMPVFETVGEVFADIRPACTMIVAGLVEEAMKVEIDVTARRG